MTNNGKVSTREFYEALLKIEPTLQRVEEKVDALCKWAEKKDIADGERDKKIDAIEKAQAREEERRKTWTVVGRLASALITLITGIAGVLIGMDIRRG